MSDCDFLESALASKSLAELRTLAGAASAELTLPQVQGILDHAAKLGVAEREFRLGIIHTYTSDLLDPWLALESVIQGLDLHVYHAPYGMGLQEAQAGSGLTGHKPDMTLLLLKREDLHPALARPLALLDPDALEDLKGEVLGTVKNLIGHFRKQDIGQIVLTLLPSISGPATGLYDSQSARSESVWWGSLKSMIAGYLRESVQSSFFLDLDEALQQIGRERFFELRYWYSASFPYSGPGAREVARRVMALAAGIKLTRAKVIVLDADNTLWGGIIGEDGLHGIALGPEYPGNAYVDFQRRLLGFQQRGFVLAICSKNNPSDLDQVLSEHPHQVLRHDHFAARRVNWEPKPDNLVSLAEELNLGLDSFVFVDDSDHECAMVRHSLPQIEVIQAPARPVELPGCLDRVARLEVVALTEEDLAKTSMYQQERNRKEFRASVEQGGDRGDYLESLQMSMSIGVDDGDYI